MSVTTWPDGYAPMWRDEAERLIADIERGCRADWIGTERDVDLAIQSAAEHWCDVEGVPLGGSMPSFDFDGPRWHEIVEDVLSRLGLDYDEVYEVA